MGKKPKEKTNPDGSKSIVIPLPQKQKVAKSQDDTKRENAEMKREVELYITKIQKKLKDDPEVAKKAALILEQMLQRKGKK